MKRRKMTAWRDHISLEIDVSKELDANFNFPKIHLVSHWVEQIRLYRAMQQYSAKRHEQAHETNLKEGWNTANRNLNYLPQVIASQHHIFCFEIGGLNLQAFAQRCCHLQSPPFRSWSGCPLESLLISLARIHGTLKRSRWKASWHYDQRLQSITRQCPRGNALCGNIHQHAGVYQAYGS